MRGITMERDSLINALPLTSFRFLMDDFATQTTGHRLTRRIIARRSGVLWKWNSLCRENFTRIHGRIERAS